MRQNRPYHLAIWWTIFVLLFLVGCGATVDQKVTFYRDEQWTMETTITTSAQVGQLLAPLADQQAQLQQSINEMESLGVQVQSSSRQEGSNYIHTLRADGTGLDRLELVAFRGSANVEAVMVGGERQIHFSQEIGGQLLDLNDYTLTLVGGKIVSSNGNQISRGTVQWVNPIGRIEATLTEKSPLNPLLFLGPGLLVVVVGGWLMARRRRYQEGLCNECGNWLAAGARFCNICGRRR